MKAVVGSTNPVKMSVVRVALHQLFPDELHVVEGIEVPSGVSVQPKTAEETLEGATNRARNAKHKMNAEFWVGIEGGIQFQANNMVEVAYVVVLSNNGVLVQSHTSPFIIPPKIAAMIRKGAEFGPASDEFFGKENLKQGNGTIGMVSDNLYTRETYPLSAVVFAFILFKHPEFYWES